MSVVAPFPPAGHRRPIATFDRKELQRILLEEQLQVPLVAVTKFQVVRRRVKNMYVAFSDFNTGLKTAWVE